ncbi:hypothetical protein AYJ56_11295 [Brucella anthropi]|nr:hypothetical protein AYJ56_11295 [Brucella anthropi]
MPVVPEDILAISECEYIPKLCGLICESRRLAICNGRLFRFGARHRHNRIQMLTNKPENTAGIRKVSEFSEMVKNFVFQGLKIGAR